jgi:hypothetical protein
MSQGKKGMKGLAALKNALSTLKSALVGGPASMADPAPPSPSKPSESKSTRSPAQGTSAAAPNVARKPATPMPPSVQQIAAGPTASPSANRPSTPTPTVSSAPATPSGKEALKVVQAAIREVRFSVAETRPKVVSAKSSADLNGRIARGSAVLRGRPDPDPNGFVIGMDFGTSSTKTIVHQPFTAGDPTKALPVPVELRSGGLEHLWQTAIWFNPKTKTFSLSPAAGALVIEGFKAGLIQGLGGQSDASSVPRCLAAVAYLGLLFAYVVGYFDEEQPLGRTEANHYAALHLGAPVASADDTKIRLEFQRIAAAAKLIAQHDGPISLDIVDKAYRGALPQTVGDDKSGLRLFSELEGVIAGYIATPDQRPGAHMVVDVGASTLDVATFRLWDEGGMRRCDVYATAVEMLGAEALNWSRVAGVPDAVFRKACGYVAFEPFHETRKKKDRGFDRTTSDQPVKFLLVGGGRHTDLHSELFRNPGKDVYLGAPTSTPTPENRLVSDPSVDFARLLVAYGLSRDPSRLPRTRLPSETPNEPPRRKPDIEDRNIYD